MSVRILVIDDDEDFTLLFFREMGKISNENIVMSAENGYRALHLLNFLLPEVPELIFVNVRMPIMNGNEIVKEIRDIKGLGGVPVFMYSASEDPDEREQALLNGADFYYQKPFTTDGVHRMIREALESVNA